MSPKPQDQVQRLLRFIDAGPSPWHVVDETTGWLESNGFIRLRETESWSLEPGGRYFVVRDGSSVIAFTVGDDLAEGGFHVIGAHTGLSNAPGEACRSGGTRSHGWCQRGGLRGPHTGDLRRP